VRAGGFGAARQLVACPAHEHVAHPDARGQGFVHEVLAVEQNLAAFAAT
jgi:hypothetical protein